MEEDVTCRIWAQENTNGFYHRCHADTSGLVGHSYPKKNIKHILETKLTSGGVWEMLACEPNHDGQACEGCYYFFCKGLSHYHDLAQQREVLKEAVRNGADIKVI